MPGGALFFELMCGSSQAKGLLLKVNMVVQKISAVNSFTCTQQPQRRLVMRLFHSFLSVIAAFVLGGISLYIVAPSTSYFNRIGQNFQFFIRFQNLICPIAFHAREEQDTLSASACQYYAHTSFTSQIGSCHRIHLFNMDIIALVPMGLLPKLAQFGKRFENISHNKHQGNNTLSLLSLI